MGGSDEIENDLQSSGSDRPAATGRHKNIYVRFFADDWRSGCVPLSLEEEGLYIRICATYWATGKALPSDSTLAARMLYESPRTYRRVVKALIEKGKLLDGADGISNGRAVAELAWSYERSNAASAAAKQRWKGGGSRRDRPRIGRTSVQDSVSNSDRTIDPIENVEQSEGRRNADAYAGADARQNQNQNQSQTLTATDSLEPPLAQEAAGSGGGFERASLFDSGEPGAHVNCTTIIARYADGREIKIPKSIVHDTGRRMGVTQARAEVLAQRVLDSWIADDWRPDRPADALRRSMARRAGEPEQIAVASDISGAIAARWFEPSEHITMCGRTSIKGADANAWQGELDERLRNCLSRAEAKLAIVMAAAGEDLAACKLALVAAAHRKVTSPQEGARGVPVPGDWAWVQPGELEISELQFYDFRKRRSEVIAIWHRSDASAVLRWGADFCLRTPEERRRMIFQSVENDLRTGPIHAETEPYPGADDLMKTFGWDDAQRAAMRANIKLDQDGFGNDYRQFLAGLRSGLESHQ